MMYQVDKYTVSLLHFESGLKDECGKVWTPEGILGGASTSIDMSKFGTSSLYLSNDPWGNQNQLIHTAASSDFDFGYGDFTIDWWMCIEEVTANYEPGSILRGHTENGLPVMEINALRNPGFLQLFMRSPDGQNIVTSSPRIGDVSFNTWSHHAIVRKGYTFYTFQNGTLTNSFDTPLALANGMSPIIGGGIKGYIDEFRISKGIARWVKDFNPEEQPIDPIEPVEPTEPMSISKTLLRLTLTDVDKNYLLCDKTFEFDVKVQELK